MKWITGLFGLLYSVVSLAGASGLSFGDSIDDARTAYTRLALYPTIDFRHAYWGNENIVPDTTNYYLGVESSSAWNDGYSTTLLQDVQAQLWAETFFDVITFNSGIHDIARINSSGQCDRNAPIRIDLNTYKNNLQSIAQILSQHSGVVIWVDTTFAPLFNTMCAFEEDVVTYNAAAETIARQNGFYILNIDSGYQIQADVHFTQEGYQYLGSQIASCVLMAMTNHEAGICHR